MRKLYSFSLGVCEDILPGEGETFYVEKPVTVWLLFSLQFS